MSSVVPAVHTGIPVPSPELLTPCSVYRAAWQHELPGMADRSNPRD